ncbi:hypothetical protein SAMN05216315_10711 [Nitrosospira sp. Nsp18]|nr:hypothetical protein SAMN05216315_10711 [Nitrosospira sp. Nsp18]
MASKGRQIPQSKSNGVAYFAYTEGRFVETKVMSASEQKSKLARQFCAPLQGNTGNTKTRRSGYITRSALLIRSGKSSTLRPRTGRMILLPALKTYRLIYLAAYFAFYPAIYHILVAPTYLGRNRR